MARGGRRDGFPRSSSWSYARIRLDPESPGRRRVRVPSARSARSESPRSGGAEAMRREMTRWRALANAGFVLAVLGLAAYGIHQVNRRDWGWQETFRARSGF